VMKFSSTGQRNTKMSNELTYMGRSGSEVLYVKDSLGVVFDDSTNLAVPAG